MSNKFGWRPRPGWADRKVGERPNALGKELKNLQGMFTVQSSCDVRLANYEERRAIELHKIEIERQRAQVSSYIQRRMYL